MNVKVVSIADLNPATYNPRKISREELDSLKRSIREFGIVRPVVVNKDMTIIGGHQTAKACLELGMKEVPIIELDITKPKEKALNLALNKISGDWDQPKLTELLAELNLLKEVDIELTGFDEKELEKLMEKQAKTPEVHPWELSDVYLPFWIVVRGPIEKFDRLKPMIDTLRAEGLVVETSL